jgi:hypothetical protein
LAAGGEQRDQADGKDGQEEQVRIPLRWSFAPLFGDKAHRSSAEQHFADVAALTGARRDREEGAADVLDVLVERVVEAELAASAEAASPSRVALISRAWRCIQMIM